MADQLPTVFGDSGGVEVTPVMLFGVDGQPTNGSLGNPDSAAFTSIPAANASTVLLAANSARRGAIIVNSDSNTLYVDMSGGTASQTRHAYQVVQHGSLEIPFGYTGAITGYWATTSGGAALVTEFS